MATFTKIKDGNVVVEADRLELYIPKILFSPDRIDKDIEHSAVATSVGESFRIIALVNARVAMTPEDKIEDSKLYTLNYPQLVITNPSGSETRKIALYPGDELEEFIVLKYTTGDILMPMQNPQNVDNCTKFLNILVRGQIPRTIKYEDIFKAWKMNLELNDANPGVPDAYLQCIISEIYRDRNNPRQPFRMRYGKDMSKNNYEPYNIRSVVSVSSVFSSQTFEHMSRMMTTSVNISRRGLEQNRSPAEAVLWM